MQADASETVSVAARGAARNGYGGYMFPAWFLPASVLLALLFLIVTTAAHLWLREGVENLIGFDQLFNVDAESNLPTWFAAFLLQVSALIAWSIGDYDAPRERKWWRGIAALLLVMSLDEVANLHHAPTRMLRDITGVQDGLLLNAWILPGALVILLVGACYLRFLLRRPLWFAVWFACAAALFVIGAVGLEILSSVIEYEAGGFAYDGRTTYSLAFEMTAVLEEVFEYAGSLLALFLLLRYAAAMGARFSVTFSR